MLLFFFLLFLNKKYVCAALFLSSVQGTCYFSKRKDKSSQPSPSRYQKIKLVLILRMEFLYITITSLSKMYQQLEEELPSWCSLGKKSWTLLSHYFRSTKKNHPNYFFYLPLPKSLIPRGKNNSKGLTQVLGNGTALIFIHFTTYVKPKNFCFHLLQTKGLTLMRLRAPKQNQSHLKKIF